MSDLGYFLRAGTGDEKTAMNLYTSTVGMDLECVSAGRGPKEDGEFVEE